MAREFSVGGDGLTTVNAVVTLVGIRPSASPNTNIDILRMWASQSGTVTSAMQRVEAVTQVTAFPTLVAATPRPLKRGDQTASVITGGTAAAAGTAGINASAEGGGAKTVMFGDNFNNLNGYLWVPTPRELINLPTGDLSVFSLYLPAAPSNTGNWAAGMNFGEV